MKIVQLLALSLWLTSPVPQNMFSPSRMVKDQGRAHILHILRILHILHIHRKVRIQMVRIHRKVHNHRNHTDQNRRNRIQSHHRIHRIHNAFARHLSLTDLQSVIDRTGIILYLLYGKANPSVLIGSFLVGISPYGPFPWKRS